MMAADSYCSLWREFPSVAILNHDWMRLTNISMEIINESILRFIRGRSFIVVFSITTFKGNIKDFLRWRTFSAYIF